MNRTLDPVKPKASKVSEAPEVSPGSPQFHNVPGTPFRVDLSTGVIHLKGELLDRFKRSKE